ncbi:MAG: hypothetical protein WC498_01910 [Candidatus Saccharimonadales bacterium]
MTMGVSEVWLPEAEPTVLYMEQAVMNTHTDHHQAAYADVLDYVDTHLDETTTVLSDYLCHSSPAKIRTARRIVEHLVTHPDVVDESKLSLAGIFNSALVKHGLQDAPNTKVRVKPVTATLNADRATTVDDLPEVS